jgi:hypothetical protein
MLAGVGTVACGLYRERQAVENPRQLLFGTGVPQAKEG